MKLLIVGTGSSGNAYILDADGQKLILDAGMPMKQIIQTCRGLKGVEGCLITHEHNDHARAVFDMTHYGIPVCATWGTIDVLTCGQKLVPLLNGVEMARPFQLENFTVLPFPTEHDAQEPCGFLIQHRPTGIQILYATDTYYLKNTFPNINFWIIECNYIDETLKSQIEEGLVERTLANRLRKSHMSLARLKQTLKANDLSSTAKIVLIHLSDARSNEEQMVKEISELTGIETIAADAGMEIDLNMTPF